MREFFVTGTGPYSQPDRSLPLKIASSPRLGFITPTKKQVDSPTRVIRRRMFRMAVLRRSRGQCETAQLRCDL